MSIPRTLRKYIEAGRLDEVESAWLSQIESAPTELDFFVAGARALKGAGEEPAARTLLELLYDEWKGEGDEVLELRLELLREVGLLMFDPAELHEEALTLLRALYSGQPSLEGFIEQVGLTRAVEDTRKNWQKVGSLRAIMQFEVGSIVWMKGKGAGRVVDVNFELGSFKIDFERSPGLRVRFGGAAKLLRALSEEHILRRKIENPEELLEMRQRDPGELLLLALRSYDEPRSATQVRESVAGIVEVSKWSSFWNAARKNPQVLTEGKGARQLYSAVASTEDAESAVVAAFERADIKGKLDIFRRNSERNDALRSDLAGRLIDIAEASPASDIELRFAVAHALRDAPEYSHDVAWSPHSMISSAPDAAAVFTALSDKTARERAYELVQQDREDWFEVFSVRLASENEPKLLDRIAVALAAQDSTVLDDFYDRVLAQPRKQAPAFVWMAERAQEDPEMLARKPLRFLQALLASSQPRELEVYKSRLKKVLEDGGPIARLIQAVSPDQAASAEELLKRSLLEEYLRGPLIDSLHMRFPEMREADESPLYALASSIEARQAELKELREVEIPTNRKAIEEARELGDLRENFEYKSARQRHEYLAARQAGLMTDLARARPLDLERSDADEVRVASTVTVGKPDGSRQELLILGPWESDPERDVISYDSDFAKALLGLAPGATAEFGGETFEIESIAAWNGDKG